MAEQTLTNKLKRLCIATVNKITGKQCAYAQANQIKSRCADRVTAVRDTAKRLETTLVATARTELSEKANKLLAQQQATELKVAQLSEKAWQTGNASRAMAHARDNLENFVEESAK